MRSTKMCPFRSRLGLVLALVAFPGWAVAQQPSAPAETFTETVDVEIVNVEIFVTDKKGAPIVGLGKDDFELSVAGEEQPISNFYAAVGGRPVAEVARPAAAEAAGELAEAPPTQRLHVAVVVDNAHIRAVNRKRVFERLRTFLDSRLAEGDLVTVASLEPELVIHADFLPDRRAIHAVLDGVERAADRPRNQEMERQQILSRLSTVGREYDRRNYADSTRGFDSPDIISRIRAWAESEYIRSQATLKMLGGLVGSLAGVHGRKALLYVSDGIPNRPGEEMFVAWRDRFGDGTPAAQGLRSAAFNTDYFREVGRFDLTRQVEEVGRLANSSRVTWYSLDAEGDRRSTLQSAGMGGGVSSEALDVLEANVREPLELAAALTGGRRIQASAGLGDDLAAIGTELDNYYSLGFAPPPGAGKADHRIRVKVRGKGLVVRHRDSWEPRSSDERAAERVTAALLYHAVSNPLAVDLEPGEPQRREDGGFVLPVEVRIPLANVLLVPRGDIFAAQLSIFVTTRDQRGQARQVQKLPFNAAIPADKVEAARGQAARYTLPLVVRSGDQQLAIGVRDELAASESYVRLELTSLLSGGG